MTKFYVTYEVDNMSRRMVSLQKCQLHLSYISYWVQ